MEFEWFEESEPVDNDEGYELHGVWIFKGEETVVDGESWVPAAGGMGKEWVRITDGKPNGSPHIVPTYGYETDGGYPNFSHPLDWDDDKEPNWSAGVPVTIHGFDYTEYDVEYTEEYENFADAVRAGKELAKIHAKST